MFLTQKEKDFIKNNPNIDPKSLIFKKDSEDLSYKKIAIQLEARKRIRKKIPSWYQNPNVFFPVKLSLEQSSSEKTAQFKKEIFPEGNTIVDITGGMGIDISFLSEKYSKTYYFEINEELSEISKYNFEQLGLNIHSEIGNGIELLTKNNLQPDIIYTDPARRNQGKKVYHLEDCIPNLIEEQEFLLSKCKYLISKHSPMIDLDYLMDNLKNISKIYIISIANECKEVITFQHTEKPSDEIQIICCQLDKKTNFQTFTNKDRKEAKIEFTDEFLNYIYIPDVSILKANTQQNIAQKYHLKKLALSTNIYTSNELLVGYPGRIFELKNQNTQIKRFIKNITSKKVEIICKNTNQKPDFFYKKMKLQKGSDLDFVIIGKNRKNKNCFAFCVKIQ
jgi:hypothetical protein